LEASLSHFLDLKLMSLIEKYSFKEKLVYLKQKNIYKSNFLINIDKKTIIFDLDETLIHSFSEK
jgi:predicted HAD superfamily phosphohydrolase YqeG